MRKSTGAVWVVGLAMLAPVAAAAATPRPAERPVFGDVLAGSALAFRTQLLDAAPRRLAGAAWWGGTYSVPGGEHVSINISSRISPRRSRLAETR